VICPHRTAGEAFILLSRERACYARVCFLRRKSRSQSCSTGTNTVKQVGDPGFELSHVRRWALGYSRFLQNAPPTQLPSGDAQLLWLCDYGHLDSQVQSMESHVCKQRYYRHGAFFSADPSQSFIMMCRLSWKGFPGTHIRLSYGTRLTSDAFEPVG